MYHILRELPQAWIIRDSLKVQDNLPLTRVGFKQPGGGPGLEIRKSPKGRGQPVAYTRKYLTSGDPKIIPEESCKILAHTPILVEYQLARDPNMANQKQDGSYFNINESSYMTSLKYMVIKPAQ